MEQFAILVLPVEIASFTSHGCLEGASQGASIAFTCFLNQKSCTFTQVAVSQTGQNPQYIIHTKSQSAVCSQHRGEDILISIGILMTLVFISNEQHYSFISAG